jgi:hypothetical protein
MLKSALLVAASIVVGAGAVQLARRAISFWKSCASSTEWKSGTSIDSSTNRGGGVVPRLQWM